MQLLSCVQSGSDPCGRAIHNTGRHNGFGTRRWEPRHRSRLAGPSRLDASLSKPVGGLSKLIDSLPFAAPLALVWSSIDTWAIVTAALIGAACAIPGCYLFLRKQSMMADALTHAVLPGVILAFLIAGWMESAGWVDEAGGWGVRHLMMLSGAMLAGLLTAWLSEWIGDSDWVRADAALGTVFTTLFAIGLILLSRFANHADVDLDCVLYGNLEMVGYTDYVVPLETLLCGAMLVFNVIAVVVMFKELSITTFDPQLA